MSMEEIYKNAWEEVLEKYSKALGDFYSADSKFKALDSSIRNMLKYHSERYIKEKQFDPESSLCRSHRDTVATLAIILDLDYRAIWDELDGIDGEKKAVL